MIRQFLQSLWTRAILRGIHYRDRYERFDQLYRIEDPWHMGNESEQFRFEETNRLIRKHFGHVGAMLEIGCGEGHQTTRLAELCTKLYAIDISSRAVERAKQKCPQVSFGTGDVFTAPILTSAPRFDLVVACEVLYYMRDLPAVLARLDQLGRSCFITYVMDQHPELGPALERIPHRQEVEFTHNQVSWRAVWWSAEQDSAAN